MNIIQLYRDYGIQFATEGHKHCRPGWVNVECPFCTGNPGYHLGATIEDTHFVCWRCGSKPLSLAIAKLLKITETEAKQVIRQYAGHVKTEKPKTKIRRKAHKIPTNVEPLQNNHRKYLIRRGFSPDDLIEKWKIQGTGPISMLDKISYKHRIFIPIFWGGKQVSFTSRSISNKTKYRYMSCPEARELIPHKQILYGKEESWGDAAVCVEGPIDVWRMGVNSFGVFGINYSYQQMREIARRFKHVPVLFDDDPQAVKQADVLVSELKFRGVDSYRVKSVPGDPGGLSQSKANEIMKKLLS